MKNSMMMFAVLLMATTAGADAQNNKTQDKAQAKAEMKRCKDEANFPLIETSELKGLVDTNNVALLDANNAETFKEHHIGDAVLFGAHKKDLAAKLPADKNALIVAYCGNEKCSAWKSAAEAACALGYTQIKHFKPGIQGWAKANAQKPAAVKN